MKKIFIPFVTLLLSVWTLIIVAVVATNAQAPRFIRGECPRPNNSFYASVTIQTDGNINAIPCPTKNFMINGVAVTGGGGGGITGLTVNRFPYATSATTVANSPYSWNGSQYVWNNTALNSAFTMNFTPSTASGLFNVGNLKNFISINQSAEFVRIFSNDIGGITQISGGGSDIDLSDGGVLTTGLNGNLALNITGAVLSNTSGSGGGGSNITLTGNNANINAISNIDFVINGSSVVAVNADSFNLRSSKDVRFAGKMITPNGTTGNQVINQVSGTVNLSAASQTITVTNSLVTANSIINVTARTNDATCYVKNYVASAGSFTINMVANCSAETSIGFIVTN